MATFGQSFAETFNPAFQRSFAAGQARREKERKKEDLRKENLEQLDKIIGAGPESPETAPEEQAQVQSGFSMLRSFVEGGVPLDKAAGLTESILKIQQLETPAQKALREQRQVAAEAGINPNGVNGLESPLSQSGIATTGAERIAQSIPQRGGIGQTTQGQRPLQQFAQSQDSQDLFAKTGDRATDLSRSVQKRELDLKLTEAGSKKAQDFKLAREKERVDANTRFLKTASLFKNLVSQIKGKGEEQGGLGLIPGFFGAINVAFKNPNFSRTASFPGQRRETALTLNGVITGQNRVIKSVVEMINETLPEENDPGSFAASKIDQSLRNAFGLTLAFQKAGFTSDVLEKLSQEQLDNIDARGLFANMSLTEQEQGEINEIIDDVLSSPASKPRQLIKERSSPKDMLGRAKKLRAENPNLSKQEIMRMVNGGR